MFIQNANVKIYKNTAVIYEGEPPDDLNIELFYSDENVKFKIESSENLTGTNTITITGKLDSSPVSEDITCTGYVSEGSAYFDFIESISFSFEDTTNIKIRGITSNGNDNKALILESDKNNIHARVKDLRWSKVLQDMGVIFEKSKMIYLPIHLALDNTFIIEYNEENYSIIQLARGERHQEIIMTRID